MPRNRPRARRASLRWLVPLIAVVLAGAVATYALVMTTEDSPVGPASSATSLTEAASPHPTHTATPTPTPTSDGKIAVLGDSFVEGVGSSTDYVTTLGVLLGVTTVAYGETGTGLVNFGEGLPYDQRLAAILYTKPVGLIVQASVNDYETSTDAVVAAASTLISHARSIDEDLPIAMVGPIYLDTEAQPAVLSQRKGLRELCAELDVTYVDPNGWITDDTKAQLIGSDNLHPTSAGYTRIADKMAAALMSWASKLP